MKFLGSGKVKDIYDIGNNELLFRFSDRISAFDIQFNDLIPQKGKILCKFSKFWFDKINYPNHLIRVKSDNEIIVKKLKMLPIECVVRGYFYGSIVSRYENKLIKIDQNNLKLASKLNTPIFDPTTKSHTDEPVSKTNIVKNNIDITSSIFDELSQASIQIYMQMSQIIDSVGFILADLKLEFGLFDDQIILADSIGPDECRLWSKKSYNVGNIQESFDKQILRDWLILHNYKQKFDLAKQHLIPPKVPKLPIQLINKIQNRYVRIYKQITKTVI